MLQSFGNNSGFISVISNGRDKNASVIYSGTGPGQTSTDSASSERAEIQLTDGLKACVKIRTYTPVI